MTGTAPATDRSVAPAADDRPLVRLDSIQKSFAARRILDGVSLTLDRGEFVALIGTSGSGKTTLVRILAGLEGFDGGALTVPTRRAVVFQEPRLLPWMSVWKNVALGRRPVGRSTADRVLEEVGLSGHNDAWPLTLSGGEAQRVALARALVREPELLLLDEPFAALDALTRIKMHALVQRLIAAHRPATVLVTHDVDEAILLADRVTALSDGAIIDDAVVDLPRPRSRNMPGFAEQRTRLLRLLGVSEEGGD